MSTLLKKFEGVRDLLREESFQVFIDGQEDLLVRTLDLEDGWLKISRLMTHSGAGLQRFRELDTVELRIDLDVPFVLVFRVEDVSVDQISLGQSQCFSQAPPVDDDLLDTDDPSDLYTPAPRSPASILFRMRVISSSF